MLAIYDGPQFLRLLLCNRLEGAYCANQQLLENSDKWTICGEIVDEHELVQQLRNEFYGMQNGFESDFWVA